MGGAKNQVTLTFAGDAEKLDRSFKQVGTSAKAMSDKVEHESGRSGSAFGRFGASAAVASAAIGVAVIDFAKESVSAYSEAEASAAKLADAFQRFPKLADSNIAAFQKLNTELAKKTKFDDDALGSGQAVLAQYKLTGNQVQHLTPLLADYAAKTGKTVPEAADVLGKALLGKGKALAEVGIKFKDTGTVAGNYAEIMKGLGTQVGGFAEKEGKTAGGQLAILSNQFGELKETVGAKLMPVLTRLAEVGLKVVDFISQNVDVLGPLAAVIGVVVAAQWLWNIAMAANPIGLIIVAVAALIAIIVIIATKTTWFQTIWRVAWGGIKTAAEAVWNWLKQIPGWIEGVFKTVAGAISAPFRAAFNFVADAWNNTVGRLSWSVPAWIPFIGGKTISVPHLPHFHSGGVVPNTPGGEMLAVLQSGETVTPRGAAGGGVAVRVAPGGDSALAAMLHSLAAAGILQFVVEG